MLILQPTIFARSQDLARIAVHTLRTAQEPDVSDVCAAVLRERAAGQFGAHHLTNIARRLEIHRALGVPGETDPQLLADLETLLRVLRVVPDEPQGASSRAA